MPKVLNYLYIGLGGFLGAISRYQISKWVSESWPGKLPLGTLTVNVSGSLIIGILLGLNWVREQEHLRMFLTTGFLGALTTFSTFSYQTVTLFSAGETAKAGINMLLNTVLSVSAAAFGLWISSRI